MMNKLCEGKFFLEYVSWWRKLDCHRSPQLYRCFSQALYVRVDISRIKQNRSWVGNLLLPLTSIRNILGRQRY